MTPEQVKAKLRAEGTTITQWAEERGYPRAAVYRVLNGVEKAAYGRAHKIAVDLGLKTKTSPEHVAA